MAGGTEREALGLPRDQVVLVDEAGISLGAMDKLRAHEPPGHLHLAFSVVLFAEQMTLLQQRALTKYHFAGSWANACCSHPVPGENPQSSARRRLVEELGIAVALEPAGSFCYRAHDPASGLVEQELDQVFFGELGGPFTLDPDPSEVADWLLVPIEELRQGSGPVPLTPWTLPAIELALKCRKVPAF